MNSCKFLCQTFSKQLRPISVTLDDIQPEDVIFYSRLLGIDLYRERHLLWIALSGLLSPLPKFWTACEDRRGRVYYFNTKNNYSTWINPNDIELQSMVNEIRKIDTMNNSLNRLNSLNRSSLLQDLIPEEIEEESVSEIDFKDDFTASNSIESIDKVNLNNNQQNPQESFIPNGKKVENVELSSSSSSPSSSSPIPLSKKSQTTLKNEIKNVNVSLTDEYEDDFEQVSIEDVVQEFQTKNENVTSEEFFGKIQLQVKNCETNLTQAMHQMGRELERTIQTHGQISRSNESNERNEIDLHKEIETISSTVRMIHLNFLEKQTFQVESSRQTNDALLRIDSVLDKNVKSNDGIVRQIQTLLESFANQNGHFEKIEENFLNLKEKTLLSKNIESHLEHLKNQNDHLLKNNQNLLHTIQSKSSQESNTLNLSEFDSKFYILEQKVDTILQVLDDLKRNSSNNTNSDIVKLVCTNEQTQTDALTNANAIKQENIVSNLSVSNTLKHCIHELNNALQSNNNDIQTIKHCSDESSSSSPEQSTMISERIKTKNIRSKSLNERKKRKHKRYSVQGIQNVKFENQMNSIHQRSHSLVSLIHQTNKQLSRELENIRNIKKFDVITTTPRATSTGRQRKPIQDSGEILQNLKSLRSKVNERIDRLSRAIELQKITNV